MSYQYFDELPDDAKERYNSKLLLLGKTASIYLVFHLLLFLKVQFHLSIWSNFGTKFWSNLQNVALICFWCYLFFNFKVLPSAPTSFLLMSGSIIQMNCRISLIITFITTLLKHLGNICNLQNIFLLSLLYNK